MQKIGVILGSLLLPLTVVVATTITYTTPTNAQNTIASTSKVCSAIVPGVFRDTINVPSGWNAGTCQSWARAIGGTNYQLGCIFSNTFSFGAPNGGTPSPNCGW